MKIKRSHYFISTITALTGLYLILLIPEKEPSLTVPQSQPVNSSPFAWNQNEYWRYLESRFVAYSRMERDNLHSQFDSLYNRAVELLQKIEATHFDPDAKEFRTLETFIFEMAPITGVCPDRYHEFASIVSRIRHALKKQSEQWDMDSPDSRNTLYRLIYGGRTALEEIMLQMPSEVNIPNLTSEVDEPSESPEGTLLGMRIRSGDILISRGTAPTSALIARGNDFPGNFSHSALVYIHPITHDMKIIESHIECGVTISTPEEYLADMKFRIMVLRIRGDLPQIRSLPLLPHNAAQYAIIRATTKHIPYDFSMDITDTTMWFCSEVVSESYRSQGIKLWMGLSHISSPGLQRWLGGFGVRNFITQEPSDLEYDPQLRVVAEWRNMETLRKDQYDNAVTEVLLDGANTGESLRYSYFLLPFARVLKFYSVLLNMIGQVGPVPEGMSAVSALRNQWYTELHNDLVKSLTKKSENFKRVNGYNPPYWQLVKMVEEIKGDVYEK
jgi:hypothetical protein